MNNHRISGIFIIIIICIAAPLSLAGCGASRDLSPLEQLRVVRTLGYDRAGDEVTLSVCVETPGEDTPPLRLKSTGGGVREALDGLRRSAGEGELFYAHTQFIVLGRAAAEESARELLDYVKRDESLRLGAWLFVAEGSAAELVAEAGEADFDVTEALESARRELQRRGGRAGDLREAAVALDEYGAAPVCMLRAEETDGRLAVAASGYGALRDGKLVGVLPAGESEVLSLLYRTPGTRTRSVCDGAATLEYTGSGSLRPRWNADGSPGPMEVSLRIQAGVAEGGGGVPADTLREALRTSLESDLRALLKHVQAMDADLPALGKALRVDGGRRFSALPPDWLTRLEFDVSVEAELSRGYDLDAAAAGEGRG